MSQETVRVKSEVVRRLFWAFENDTAAFRDTLHPEIEWFPIDENRGRLYGIEAALRNRNEWLDTWDEHRFELDELFAEGDSVVVSVHITARGTMSGAVVDVRFYAHFKLRDDKVVYIYDHADRAAALEAAGRPEYAMSQEHVDLAEQGVAAINEAYATQDIAPWRQQVEKVVDPELLLDGSRDVFTEGDWRGKEGAVAFVANQMEVLEEMWMRLDEFIDVDENRFIMGITFGGRARHTAIPVELHPFHVFTLRDGRILRWQIFRTREEALEAVGLSE